MNKYLSFLSFLFFVFPSIQGQNLGAWVENKGQFMEYETVFEGEDLRVCMDQKGLFCRTPSQHNRLSLIGAQIKTKNLVFEDPYPYHHNYIYKHCAKGIYRVKAYRKLTVKNVYPHIDWVLFTETDRSEFQFTFVVREGGDSTQIAWVEEQKHTESALDKNKDTLYFMRQTSKIIEFNLPSIPVATSKSTDENSPLPPQWNGREPDWATRIVGRKDLWLGYSDLTTDVNNNLYIGLSQYNFVNDENSDYILFRFDSTGHLKSRTYCGTHAHTSFLYTDEKKNLYIVGIRTSDATDYPMVHLNGAYTNSEGSAYLIAFDENEKCFWSTLLGKDISFAHGITGSSDNCLYLKTSSNRAIHTPSIYPPGAYHYESTDIDSMQHISSLMKFDSKRKLIWKTHLPISNGGHRFCVSSSNKLLIGANIWSSDLPKLPFKQKANAYFRSTVENTSTSTEFTTNALFQFSETGALEWCTLLDSNISVPNYLYISGFEGNICSDKNDNIYLCCFVHGDIPLREKAGAFFLEQGGRNTSYLMQFNADRQLVWSTYLSPTDMGEHLKTISHVSISPKGNLYAIVAGNLSHILKSKEKDSSWYMGLLSFSLEGSVRWSSCIAPIIPFYSDKENHSWNTSPPQSHINTKGEIFVSGAEHRQQNVLFGRFIDPKDGAYMDTNSQGVGLFLLRYQNCAHLPTPLFPDTLLCPGDTLFLSPNYADYTPSWSEGSSRHYLVPENSADYSLHLLSPYPECPDLYSNTFHVELLSDDSLKSSGILPYALCPQDTISLSAQFHPYCSWAWQTPNLHPKDTLYSVFQAGLYPIEYTHRCSKSVLDTFLVYPLEIPSVHLHAQLPISMDTILSCVGENIVFSAKGNDVILPLPLTIPDLTEYLWYNGSRDSTHKVQYRGDSAFWVWVEVSNSCGSSRSDSLYFLYKPPYVYLGEDTVLCHSDSLVLNAYGEAYEYRWQMEGIIGIDTTPTYTLHPPGGNLRIEVHLQNSLPGSCIARDTIAVSYYSYSDVKWRFIDTLGCKGLPIDLDPNGAEDAKYRWLHRDSATNANPFVHPMSIEDSGFYQIWVKNYCSMDSGSLHLAHYPFPQKQFSADTVLCHEDSLHIDLRTPYIHFLWYDGDTNPVRTIFATPEQSHDQKMAYIVSYQSVCPNYKIVKDTLEIAYIYPPYFRLPMDTMQCRDQETEIEIEDADFYRPAYRFRWQDGSTGESYIVRDSGWYVLEISHALCNVSHQDSVYFAYVPWEWTNIRYPQDTNACENLEFILDVSNSIPNTLYSWSDNATETAPLRRIDKDLETELTLTDALGCANKQRISVHFEECKAILEAPNVITPNGDGINDVFRLRTAEKIIDLEFTIFNSWGLKVYSYKGEASHLAWEGKQQGGQPVPDGAYFFIATFKDVYGKKFKETACIMVLR